MGWNWSKKYWLSSLVIIEEVQHIDMVVFVYDVVVVFFLWCRSWTVVSANVGSSLLMEKNSNIPLCLHR